MRMQVPGTPGDSPTQNSWLSPGGGQYGSGPPVSHGPSNPPHGQRSAPGELHEAPVTIWPPVPLDVPPPLPPLLLVVLPPWPSWPTSMPVTQPAASRSAKVVAKQVPAWCMTVSLKCGRPAAVGR